MGIEHLLNEATVDELAAAVDHHNRLYWQENTQEISDPDFDRLVKRLQELEPSHPSLLTLGPPDVGALGETVQHRAPMLSLDKCYEESELLRWAEGFAGGIVESPKIDGVAASFRYDAEGRLALAATRGDGTKGEEFTANARSIPSVPRRLTPPAGETLPPETEVRGEVYMPLGVFRDKYAEEAANPRNLTAGSIKRKQDAQKQLGDLRFFAYDLVEAADATPRFATEQEKSAYLRTLGFTPVESKPLERDELQTGYEQWLARRDGLDYELDGVVYKADRVDEQRRLGATAHHPRYAIAYKFQGDSGHSTLEAVEWSVARTGAITPVAIIAPVLLSGAMVSRCSLHNLNILRRHALKLGDTVVAMRRGGVIPNIELSQGGGGEPVVPPTECPSCGAPTREESDVLYCSAPETCRDVQLAVIEHYVKATEIDRFGRKLLEQLWDMGKLRSLPDLYTLSGYVLVELDRVGDVLARKLLANVDNARRLDTATFLRALGIDELGRQAAQLLVREVGGLAEIRAADAAQLEAIKGVGPTIARNVVDGLADRAELIAALLEHVEVLSPSAATATAVDDEAAVDDENANPLAGHSVVFTGKLASLSRKAAQTAARAVGATTPSGVTKDLGYLVVGDDGSPLFGDGRVSSKQKKAERYNGDGAEIRIISETEFRKLAGM